MGEKLCVIGLGYIGLPTACLFAAHGHQVVGVDTNKDTVGDINRGKLPFKEAGLDEFLKKALELNNLSAKTEPETTDVFLIAVPTPLEKKTLAADLNHVEHATRSIVRHLQKGSIAEKN